MFKSVRRWRWCGSGHGSWGTCSSTASRTAPPHRLPRTPAGVSRVGSPVHPGSMLAQIADPDEVLRHEPGPWEDCGADLNGAPQVGVERRQLFDLPPIWVRVIE